MNADAARVVVPATAWRLTMRRGLVRIAAGAVLVMTSALAVAGEAADSASDPALEARVARVAAELRCLVCQNQNLADSHAGLALDLKNQVREQLRAGRSESQVVDYMTDRYGDFVRYRPAFKPSTLLLWSGPLLFVLLGVWLLQRTLRARPRETPAAAAPIDITDADRLLGLGPPPGEPARSAEAANEGR